MTVLRPQSGTSSTRYDKGWQWKSRYAHRGECGICGDYDGLHLRCWWTWLTEERELPGYHDGEQQIEPDEPYPSRWRMLWRPTLTLIDPRWWRLCWRERMSPWPWNE